MLLTLKNSKVTYGEGWQSTSTNYVELEDIGWSLDSR